MRIVVNEVALKRSSLLVLLVFLPSIFPPLLHARLSPLHALIKHKIIIPSVLSQGLQLYLALDWSQCEYILVAAKWIWRCKAREHCALFLVSAIGDGKIP
jgi:hypothetical protein